MINFILKFWINWFFKFYIIGRDSWVYFTSVKNVFSLKSSSCLRIWHFSSIRNSIKYGSHFSRNSGIIKKELVLNFAKLAHHSASDQSSRFGGSEFSNDVYFSQILTSNASFWNLIFFIISHERPRSNSSTMKNSFKFESISPVLWLTSYHAKRGLERMIEKIQPARQIHDEDVRHLKVIF